MRRTTHTVKYHGVIATLRADSASGLAVLMDATHPDYGTLPGIWVPRSVIHEDSLEEIDAADEGDELEVFIAAWWFRRNYGECS